MADQRLTWALCDSQGLRIASLADRLASKVSIGVNDIRNGTVTLSLEDPAVALAYSQPTRLKAWLGEEIILNAPVFLPHAEGSAGQGGTVELSATDNVQLATAFTLDFGVPAELGAGSIAGNAVTADQSLMMWYLIRHADYRLLSQPGIITGAPSWPLPHYTPNSPSHGIIAGSLPTSFDRTLTYFDGQNIWDEVTGIAGLDAGPDFELKPLDRADGVFMQLDTFPSRQGSDRSATVKLESGCGRHNAGGWSWDRSKEQLVNRWVAGSATGEGQPGGLPRTGAWVTENTDSQDLYGVYSGFEVDPSIVAGDDATMQSRGARVVSRRAFPIDFFSIIPAVEQGGTAVGWARDPSGELVEMGQGYGVPPRFAPDGDYWLGDTIGIVVKEGVLEADLAGRVSAANIVETDEAGNVAVELSCTPKEGVAPTSTYNIALILSQDEGASFDVQGDSSPDEEPPSTGKPRTTVIKQRKRHRHHR